jgi:hypothetical protein
MVLALMLLKKNDIFTKNYTEEKERELHRGASYV